MKSFFASMLGTLVGLFLFLFLALILIVGIIGAIVSLGAHRVTVSARHFESGSYLVLDLSTNLTDAPPILDFGALRDDHPGTLQLRTATRILHRAAADSRIAGLLIKGSFAPSGYGSGYAALRELRQAILEFRRTGKPVRAFLEGPELRDYYVATAANEIDLEPYSVLFLPGLASEPVFVAGALDKYGIGVQVSRVGKYKSAVEMFTRTSMSPEDRAQLQQLLGGMWRSLLDDIALSRGVTPAAIQSLMDEKGIIRADDAKRARLVDQVLYRDEVIAALRDKTGEAEDAKTFKQVSFADYARINPELPGRGSNQIAVLYAEGEIVDGDGQAGQVGGERFAAEIRKLRQDDDVKAIVLRVNSPGGSVTASEEIERELTLARKVKPVVVSMGSYAASGGYWISAGADRIFAEPTTVTGSIGVFDLQFDIQKLAADHGITFDRVTTGRFADSQTIARPKTPEELAIVQNEVDWIYGQFIGKVAAGRQLPADRVREIAQGRVWSGVDARGIGLVDQIGGLGAAIQYASRRAGVPGNYSIEEYPTRRDLADQVLEMIDRLSSEQSRIRGASLADQLTRRLGEELSVLNAFNDPRGLYARLPLEFDFIR